MFHSSTTQSFFLNLIPQLAQTLAPVDISVRHPSSLTANDFDRDNALLISGPYGNPWVQLFDRQLNFQIEFDPTRHITQLRNLHPLPGEKLEYANYSEASRTQVCYARVAYLPGHSAASRIILVGGPHNVSTEASILFAIRPESLAETCRLFKVNEPASLPWFELIIQSRALGGAAWDTRVVAHRQVKYLQN
jgi:hypothetical protein